MGKKFDIRNGFATLRNKVYVFKPTHECDKYFYFLKDKQEYKVEKKICRDAIKPNILKSETKIKEFTEKLLFPYKLMQGNNDLFNNNELLKLLMKSFLRLIFHMHINIYYHKKIIYQKEIKVIKSMKSGMLLEEIKP